MSSATGSNAMPGWYWPDDVPKEEPSDASASFRQRAPHASSSTDEPPKEEPARHHPSTTEPPRPEQGPSSRRRHWPPRQCRICLDTVQPTFDLPSEHLPGFLQSASNVKYEDENGRLIRPCMCKGSSKYVHEACLQAWRHADPGYGRRNYFQCPTCGFRYQLSRLGAGRFVASLSAQIILTITILITAVFILGFIADPIINLYLDPWGTLMPWSSSDYYHYDDDEPTTWYEHFAKGIASMGVLGFLKVLVANPFSYFRIGGGRARNTGRDRYEQVSWIIILIGVGTFLAAIYKGVRAWSRRTLEKAGERVMDVQGDDDDEDD
ncbi:hypothetical protein CC80DRAFT_496375 [Byssothecium circinans]|uniref:RING-CH-type domain-containing protein n=1 Tax=Byssothecium circinans TaxID=147558 RepID=A0A6A5THG0_9PLEO|nr:hypothetical protein CC80DRAFT_496375 [Byssothecium circinans]